MYVHDIICALHLRYANNIHVQVSGGGKSLCHGIQCVYTVHKNHGTTFSVTSIMRASLETDVIDRLVRHNSLGVEQCTCTDHCTAINVQLIINVCIKNITDIKLPSGGILCGW